MTTLEASSHVAGMLACPQCGGAASASDKHCSFCATPLMLKGCPRCMSRVFHGHKHCPECGAGLEQAAADAHAKDMPCPRCDRPLLARRVGDLVIDECGGCHGLFLDQVAIKRVITDRAQARAEALLGALPKGTVTQTVGPGQRMYLKCPHCHVVMNRKQFATGAGVIVDVCKAHGTFFDVGELPTIIEFVQQGGLEKAKEKELARRVEQAKAAEQRAQFAALQAGRSSSHAWEQNERMGRGVALVDLLSALWH